MNIQRFVVKFQWSDFDAFSSNRTVDDFKIYSKKGGTIKWFQIELDHQIGLSDQITQIDVVCPVHCLRTNLNIPNGQTLVQSLKNLVQLELRARSTALINCSKLAKSLQHLEILKISFERAFRRFLTTPIIMPLVTKPKQKLIEVIVNEYAIVHSLQTNCNKFARKRRVGYDDRN